MSFLIGTNWLIPLWCFEQVTMFLWKKHFQCLQLSCLLTWRRGKVKRSRRKLRKSAASQGISSIRVSARWRVLAVHSCTHVFTCFLFYRWIPSVRRHVVSVHSSQHGRGGGQRFKKGSRKCGSCCPVQSRVSWQRIGHGSLGGRFEPTFTAGGPARPQHATNLHTKEAGGCVQAK